MECQINILAVTWLMVVSLRLDTTEVLTGGQAKTQWNDQNFDMDMEVDWIDIWVRTVEQPVQSSPLPLIIVPVLVEEVLQYLIDNHQTDTLPVLTTSVQVQPETETVFDSLSTLVSHFLHSCSLVEQSSTMAMLSLVLTVIPTPCMQGWIGWWFLWSMTM